MVDQRDYSYKCASSFHFGPISTQVATISRCNELKRNSDVIGVERFNKGVNFLNCMLSENSSQTEDDDIDRAFSRIKLKAVKLQSSYSRSRYDVIQV